LLSLILQDQPTNSNPKILALTKENNLNNDKLISNDQFKVDVPFDYLFKEFEGTLTDALNLLNMEAEEQGFKFKIGSFSNKE